MNDDFANRELSIEELDAIAGGNFFGDVWRGVERGTHSVTSALSSFFTNPIVGGIGGLLIVAGAILTGGGNPPQRMN